MPAPRSIADEEEKNSKADSCRTQVIETIRPSAKENLKQSTRSMFINTRIVWTAESQALRGLRWSNAWVVRGLSTHQLARIWPAQQRWNSGPISQGDSDAVRACEEDGVPCVRKPTVLAGLDWSTATAAKLWAVGGWPITAFRAATLLKQSPVLKKGSGIVHEQACRSCVSFSSIALGCATKLSVSMPC